MKKKILVALGIILIGLILCGSIYLYHMNHQGKIVDASTTKGPEQPSITVLYDNYQYREGLSSHWGYSCYIYGYEKNILFDTGANGSRLIKNMEDMKINPASIDAVVLSHFHNDHISGLEQLIKENKDLDVYILESFSEKYKQQLVDKGVNVIEVTYSINICDKISTTGMSDGSSHEQSLVIDEENGLVVLTGCAHPGVNKISTIAEKLFQKDILLLMGGFHLHSTKEHEIEKIILDLQSQGVKYVAPSHCTGSHAINLFSQEYDSHFIQSGVGNIVVIEELN